MIRWMRWVLPVCTLFLFSPLLMSLGRAEPLKEEVPVVATLLSEEKTIQAGRPFWVGVELKMAEGWDTYWINPGDAGYPTRVDWQLPEGFTAGPIVWPTPERFTAQSLVAYGYHDSVLLLAQITPPQTLKEGGTTLIAHVNWLACKEQCVPGDAELKLELNASAQLPERSAQAALFDQWRAQIPRALASGEGSFSHEGTAEKLTLHFQALAGFKEIESALFIPEKGEVIDHGAPQNLQKSAQGFSLNLKPAQGKAPPDSLRGVLLISQKGQQQAIWVDTSSGASLPEAPVAQGSGFGLTLLLAFLGGLILNVMPCVLPVISLKIMSFVKMAGENRRLIMQHGASFTTGVLVSFWILALGLFALRAIGAGVGWGFQLQEPIFVAILVSVLFLLGLSLFGLFEIGTSLISVGQQGGGEEKRSKLGSSFMSGVLATLVATPCTGPLLGPALGLAMTLPTVLGLLIFTAMGLGMASPYLLLSAFPSLLRFLPKPGNWMVVFKQTMGFVMMVTVVWLLWVFGAQTSTFALTLLLLALLVLSIGGWIFGRWALPTKRKLVRQAATLCALLTLVIGGSAAVFAGKQPADQPLAMESSVEGAWGAYTPEKVAQLRAEGKGVFIDFTAKWCLICQANKAILHSSEITRLFAEKGVVTLTADWTKRDQTITEALARMGRTGVPVYAFYPAGSQSESPLILPQTLTSSIVARALNNAPGVTVHAD